MPQRWSDDRLDHLDARVADGFARVDQQFEKVDERFEQIDRRFEKIDERFEKVDDRFRQIDRRFVQIDERFQNVATREDIRELGARLDKLVFTMLVICGSMICALIAATASVIIQT